MRVLDERSSGETVTVAAGGALTVRLAENPTTGYAWSTPQFDATYVALSGDRYVPNASDTIGGGGVREFELRALRVGRTALRTALKRPWEDDARAQRGFALTLVVEDQRT